MPGNPEIVVRCGTCDKYFGHSEAQTQCPYCYTPYRDVEVKPEVSLEEKVEEKAKKRKLPIKSDKESFKIWKSE